MKYGTPPPSPPLKQHENIKWTLAVKGWGVWINPLKKENLWQKFLLDNVKWSPKNVWKIISADAKANIKQLKVKVLVTVFYIFL